MVDMPFGVSRLDSMLDGGVPTGSVVLLATEPGAGGRKFAQTSAAMNALATTDNEAFERHYRGIDHEGVIVPASVHYLSVAATTDSLEAALTETVSTEIAARAAAGITYHDLSATYFDATDVPAAWYQDSDDPPSLPPEPAADGDTVSDGDSDDAVENDEAADPFDYGETTATIPSDDAGDSTTAGDGTNAAATDAGDTVASDASSTTGAGRDASGATDTPAILSALRASLDDAVGGNLVVIDAITDLDDLSDDVVSWAAVVRLLRGLTRMVTARGGLVLVVADAEAVTDAQLGSLSAATTGTLSFGWETGGSQRARLLSIRELPGALDRLDRDEIAAFESELHDRGYDLSNVRKIR
ncbi:hypothetical protein [Halonotius sp. GCM10025705]|uniref:hypothetical protein n=1 Tax=Halonotius sp. GCM10025705 TaxID=3252678 RepID=UPI00360B0E42